MSMLKFVIGLAIGCIVGVIFTGLLTASKCSDCQSEKKRDFYCKSEESE